MRARREPKNKVKKIKKVYYQIQTCHVCAQTTHVVAMPHGFACLVIPTTVLYIWSFIEIHSGVIGPQGVKICPFPFLRLLFITTAFTAVESVIFCVCVGYWCLRFQVGYGGWLMMDSISSSSPTKSVYRRCSCRCKYAQYGKHLLGLICGHYRYVPPMHISLCPHVCLSVCWSHGCTVQKHSGG